MSVYPLPKINNFINQDDIKIKFSDVDLITLFAKPFLFILTKLRELISIQ